MIHSDDGFEGNEVRNIGIIAHQTGSLNRFNIFTAPSIARNKWGLRLKSS